MRRANGDWFALDEGKGIRVPLFHSASDAMRARSFTNGMLLFKPAVLDERALKDLESEESKSAAHFWLVDDSAVKNGQRIAFDQLNVLCRQPAPDA
jgi:hypothetical protein